MIAVALALTHPLALAPPLVLAHQGGWDEVLLILTPIVIFAALLGLANRRANAEVERRAGDAPPQTPPADDPDGTSPDPDA